MNRVITAALAGHKARAGRSARRHPADVTADRLGEATQKWEFTAEERDAVAVVVDALRRISNSHR